MVGISFMSAGGVRTLSMTWITPLLATTSGDTTVASSIITEPSVTVKDALSPFIISTDRPSVTSDDITLAPARTW